MNEGQPMLDLGSLPSLARAQIESEIEPGERLLWVGIPDPVAAIRAAGWQTFAIAVFGVAFAAFGWTVVLGGPGLYHATFFFFTGFALVAFAICRACREGRAVYVLTDSRAAILRRGIQSASTRSLRPLGKCFITADPDDRGVGDLMLCPDAFEGVDLDSLLFVGVESVEQVRKIAIEAFASGTRRYHQCATEGAVETECLPDALKERVDQHNPTGELLAWHARPEPIAFGLKYRGFQFFGGAATVFLAWGFAPNYLAGDFSVKLALGVGFMGLVAVAMLLSPYWTRLMARYSVYCTTERRALSIAPHVGFGPIDVREFDAVALQLIDRVEYRNGTGHLYVRDEVTSSATDDHGTLRTTVGFYGLREVRSAERSLMQVTPQQTSE